MKKVTIPSLKKALEDLRVSRDFWHQWGQDNWTQLRKVRKELFHWRMISACVTTLLVIAVGFAAHYEQKVETAKAETKLANAIRAEGWEYGFRWEARAKTAREEAKDLRRKLRACQDANPKWSEERP